MCYRQSAVEEVVFATLQSRRQDGPRPRQVGWTAQDAPHDLSSRQEDGRLDDMSANEKSASATRARTAPPLNSFRTSYRCAGRHHHPKIAGGEPLSWNASIRGRRARRRAVRTDGGRPGVVQVLQAGSISLQRRGRAVELARSNRDGRRAKDSGFLVNPSAVVGRRDHRSRFQGLHFSARVKGPRIGRDVGIGQGVLLAPRPGSATHAGFRTTSPSTTRRPRRRRYLRSRAWFSRKFEPARYVSRKSEYAQDARPVAAPRLGANCTIVCGVTLGRYCFVGDGSVVLARGRYFASSSATRRADRLDVAAASG
jgi:hypothetical protein